MTFCLSFGDAFPVHAVRSSSCDHLCRGTSDHTGQYELPLMGFPKITPLPFKVCCILSKHASRRKSTLGARLPSLPHGPSSSFLTTSMVCSASHPAGLLHPAAGYGVRHVSGIVQSTHRCKHLLELSDFPFPSGAGPFEVFPSTTAPVTSPRLIPSRCSSRVGHSQLTQAPVSSSLHGPANLRALLRCRVRCSWLTLP
jgi:hypothetical protein